MIARTLATLTILIGATLAPAPAHAWGSFECNPYRIHEDTGSVYRYCQESPNGGMYYVDVKLFRFYEGAPQYKWKPGTYETPSVGLGSTVQWNENIWDLVDWKTREV